MDRNSAIGLTIIAVLLLLYFNFFSSTPTPVEDKPAQVTTTPPAKKDSAVLQPKANASDSLMIRQYGNLSAFLSGAEAETKVETKDLIVILSNRGFIKQVELKKFKTYGQKPLYLVTPESNSFSLMTQNEGKEIDLYRLFYTEESTKKSNDTTVVSLVAKISEGVYLKHIYTFPPVGYQVGYAIESAGLAVMLTSQNLTYHWDDRIPSQEKDITDSRNKTTINWYLSKGEFDGFSQTTNDKTEAIADPTKWAAIRQKFFISSIIAQTAFAGGEVSVSANTRDSSYVKKATVKLFIPKTELIANQSRFTYYIGPNDYEILGSVAPGFSSNLDLGWPPVKWVNMFVIIPIFNLLERNKTWQTRWASATTRGYIR